MRWRWRWAPHRETPLTSHCPKVKATRPSVHPSHPSGIGAEDKLSEAVISFLPWNTTIVSGASLSVNVRAASRTGVQCHGMTGSIHTLSVTLTCKSSRRDGQPDGWWPSRPARLVNCGQQQLTKKTPLSPKQSSGHLPPLPLWEFLHLFCPWGPRAAILKQARLGNYSPRSKQGRHGRAIDQNSG